MGSIAVCVPDQDKENTEDLRKKIKKWINGKMQTHSIIVFTLLLFLQSMIGINK